MQFKTQCDVNAYEPFPSDCNRCCKNFSDQDADERSETSGMGGVVTCQSLNRSLSLLPSGSTGEEAEANFNVLVETHLRWSRFKDFETEAV